MVVGAIVIGYCGEYIRELILDQLRTLKIFKGKNMLQSCIIIIIIIIINLK